jgi:DNA-binding CsgD family transcriptional regulator
MRRAARQGDPVGSDLDRRFATVTSEARRALGIDHDPPADRQLDEVAALVAAVESRLASEAPEGEWREASRAHADQVARVGQRHETRAAALTRVHEAVARLRELTAPGAILSRAPKELCSSSQLDRVVISIVRDGRMVAVTAYFRDDPAGAARAVESLRRDPPVLEYPLVESDLLRRRRASIVTDAQVQRRVHRPMAETMGWQSFVAAPVHVRGEAMGIIHADSGTSGRPLDVLDADVLWNFATGLADVYEAASLQRALRRQQHELREFVEWLSVCSSALNNASIDFAPDQAEPPAPPGSLDIVGDPSGGDDRLVFEDVLTRRELDVLRLLARGDTNSGVASALVISEATVKFHVRNILTKLRAANRAQAVSRYYKLVQPRSIDGREQ